MSIFCSEDLCIYNSEGECSLRRAVSFGQPGGACAYYVKKCKCFFTFQVKKYRQKFPAAYFSAAGRLFCFSVHFFF